MGKITVLILFAVAGLLLQSCERTPVEKAGTALTDSYRGAQRAADQASLDGMNSAIRAYRTVNEGKNPESIDELEKFMGYGIDRSKFEYYPDTGTVALK